MCDLCLLNSGREGFVITQCRTCRIPLVISREHRPDFTPEEMRAIRVLFPNRKIRWAMRQIKDHAHAHIER